MKKQALTNKQLAYKVKQRQDRLGLSQAAAAEQVGVHPQSYFNAVKYGRIGGVIRPRFEKWLDGKENHNVR